MHNASGDEVKHYGYRYVEYLAEDGGDLTIKYTVSEVERPVASVGAMGSAGFKAQLLISPEAHSNHSFASPEHYG